MEEMVAASVEAVQQPKSPIEVVSNVLPGSSVFLRNVGLQSAPEKSSTTMVSAKVQQLKMNWWPRSKKKMDFGKEWKP